MKEGQGRGSGVLNAIGDQFIRLVGSLVRGNRKKGRWYAALTREELQAHGLNIARQGLIEELAQAQAVRNAVINSPSIVPGIGTLLSFWLLGVENFFILDQSVTLIVALVDLHDGEVEDDEALIRFSVKVVGEVFGVTDIEKTDSRSVGREYFTRTLPLKYLNAGFTRGVKRVLRRMLPFRSNSRLLPIGIGLVVSAYNAYDIIVSVGQTALKHMPEYLNETSGQG
jgi:hypothetical protein